MPRNPCVPDATPDSARAGTLPSPTPDPEVLAAVLDRSLTGMVLLRRGAVGVEATAVNPAAACRLGGTADDLTGTGWADGLGPRDRARLRTAAEALLAGETTRRQEEVTLPHGRRVLFCLCSLLDGSGQPMVLAQLVDRPEVDTVSWVGHELRNPITSVLGYTELLREGVGGQLSHHQTELLDRVLGHGRRLLDLVESLVTLDRVESSDPVPQAEPVVLDVVVHRALESVTALVHGRALTVRARVSPGPMEVSGDATDLERVVTELLTNATKFTPAGGRITLDLTREGSDAVLVVEDTGPGVPEHEQARLFDRFFRTSAALSQAVPGTGIGLAIVHSVVTGHGGRIRLDSAPGRGARFEVRLPLAATP
ncbi:hypothetical protein GCM10009844_09930 [Nocardioides koreensis]|uniref:Sensor-like histidine kinase SenX3 n=1 Tax=Nocardioides koreensis TaxID=433651 RepID=A0ABN2ZD24_9ACTN